MNTKQFEDYFNKAGVKFDAKNDRKLRLSGRILRGQMNGTPFAAIGGEHGLDKQLNAIVDAVHWYIHKYGSAGDLKIIFGTGNSTEKLLASAATLIASVRNGINISVKVDFKPKKLTMPDFENLRTTWLSFFTVRDNQFLPILAHRLKKMVNRASFRWYRNVTGNFWSGRIEGLEVCTVGPDPDKGILNVGKPGKNGNQSKARKTFLKEAGDKAGEFSFTNLEEVCRIIRNLSDIRKNGKLKNEQQEHYLEARILRECIPVKLGNGNLLRPVCKDNPFQFPTLWSPDGSTRFLDVLMHENEIPYAVELKVPESAGGGEYYRHAITQAVLYREFIRKAAQLHPWFASKGLIAMGCKGAVAFPKMADKQRKIVKLHKKIADMFDIEIVEL
jgi:hypothetical protein